MSTDKISAKLLGSNAITRAIAKALSLLDVEVNIGAAGSGDILVIADGDSYELDVKSLKKDFSGNELLIYFETSTIHKDIRLEKHNLIILTELLPTIRLPLEDFPFIKLCEIITSMERSKGGQLCTSYLPMQWPQSGDVKSLLPVLLSYNQDQQSFASYLYEYDHFIQRVLHDSKDERTRTECVEMIKQHDFISSLLKVPAQIDLNILVVENNPGEIADWLVVIKEHFPNVHFYLISEEFKRLQNCVAEKKSIERLINSRYGGIFETQSIDIAQVDLILQDIFLEEDNISGNEIANLYVNAAPQAMVFFLTSMDVETLTAHGYDKKVDRLLNKNPGTIQALIKYYYERFHELYGPLLWPVFIDARPRDEANPTIIDRTSIRHLLGNIRSWTMEPNILFHGFALPEMVDHSFRHTSGLWRMANDILGPFLENMPKNTMPYEDRIILSLAIWLHDIGHRGDEHHYNPIELREQHGSISENLILESYEALGIGWVRKYCSGGCDAKTPIKRKNRVTGCAHEPAELCVLRKVGLVCRYHQSTAPLFRDRMWWLIANMKYPSPYCRYKRDNEVDPDKNWQDDIQKWLDTTNALTWEMADVRTLDDYCETHNQYLINLAGMLRWLDALHTHQDKVGSGLQIKSMQSYLDMRKEYCSKRKKEIHELLDKTMMGSESYLSLLGERERIDNYNQLLHMQDVHIWRNGMVREIYGEWFWDSTDAKWSFRIIFGLHNSDHLFKSMGTISDTANKVKKNYEEDCLHKAWALHVAEEVIESELGGQCAKDDHICLIDHYFPGSQIKYYYKVNDKKEPINVEY